MGHAQSQKQGGSQMKKALLSLTLAVALIAMIAAPAFAASTFNLGEPWGFANDAGQYGHWWGDGTTDSADNERPKNGLTTAMLQNMIRIEVEAPELADGQTINIVVGGPSGPAGNPWWQELGEMAYADGVHTYTFSAAQRAWFEDNDGDVGGNIFIGGAWWPAYDTLGITKATLFYTASGGGGGGSNNAGKTGDATMIALALIALTLAAGGAFLAARKIKA
jgi:LPXTG-motif cell wall-anchored protein